MNRSLKNRLFFIILLLVGFGAGTKVFAQTSPSSSPLYVPLIGITSVPAPLALPKGPGNVIYNYAVKNFLPGLPLTNVEVTDNNCDPVKFVTGDDNGNGKLDFSETWRYSCAVKIATTTQSIATATGSLNNTAAAHSAFTTVVVGSSAPPPLVSIVNITKVPSPLFLPASGGNITFTYRVNNPGAAALSNVSVTDDGCSNMSGKLGDTNDNNLLDTNEVWIYTCSAQLKQTTANTAAVTAFANGLEAYDSATINVIVSSLPVQLSPSLFDVEISPGAAGAVDLKITVWEILSGILAVLLIVFAFTRKPGPN